MRVRVYGRTAMTFGVLAAILAAMPFGVAVPSGGAVAFLAGVARAGQGDGDATAGRSPGGGPASADGSRGSGGASARASAKHAAGAASAGSAEASSGEASSGETSSGETSAGAGKASASAGAAAGSGGDAESAAGAAADGGRGDDQGDRGGAAVSGAPADGSTAAGSDTAPAGSVEAGAPGRTAADADGSRDGSRHGPDTGAESAAGGDSTGTATSTNGGTGAATGAATSTATGAGGRGTANPTRAGASIGKTEPAGAGEATGRARTRREAPAPDIGNGPASPRPGATGERGASASGGPPPPVKAVRVERDAEGVGVVYSNQVRERISGGRLEMKDAGGRTVIDRPATAKDIERVRENVRRSGLGVARDASLPAGSEVESVAVSQDGMAVRYREGWTESLAGNRYRFADPDGNTVVDRPATTEDRSRLQAIAGG